MLKLHEVGSKVWRLPRESSNRELQQRHSAGESKKPDEERATVLSLKQVASLIKHGAFDGCYFTREQASFG
jgi:hypothetical protein